jgi:hypothetical protein
MAIHAGCSEDQILSVVVDGIDRAARSARVARRSSGEARKPRSWRVDVCDDPDGDMPAAVQDQVMNDPRRRHRCFPVAVGDDVCLPIGSVRAGLQQVLRHDSSSVTRLAGWPGAA